MTIEEQYRKVRRGQRGWLPAWGWTRWGFLFVRLVDFRRVA